MLVTFRSKAAGDLIMFEENAKQILDLFNRETKQGIILAEETAWAIGILEEEIAQKKIVEACEKAEREEKERLEKEERERKKEEGEEDNFGDEKKPPPPKPAISVPFSARAYPFMLMLKAAHRKNREIVWGV